MLNARLRGHDPFSTWYNVGEAQDCSFNDCANPAKKCGKDEGAHTVVDRQLVVLAIELVSKLSVLISHYYQELMFDDNLELVQAINNRYFCQVVHLQRCDSISHVAR